jgi:hypothetical protein
MEEQKVKLVIEPELYMEENNLEIIVPLQFIKDVILFLVVSSLESKVFV